MPLLSMNPLKKAKFLTSCASIEQLVGDIGHEVAFVGRSNCGKSSLINALTEQGKLARISKTPGRTQLINFFELDETRRLVDLPGYGFAKVHESIRRNWESLIEGYFTKRDSLRGIVLINDIRHPLKDTDVQMLDWAQHYNVPVLLVLNKSDKYSNSQKSKQLNWVKSQLTQPDTHIELASALKREGLDAINRQICDWLDIGLH